MAENLPYLAEDINLQIQEAEQTQTGWTQRNPHKKLPQFNFLKTKDKKKKKILKAAREKRHPTYTGKTTWMTDFSSETMEARKEWHNIFQELREKNCQPRILYI